MFDAAIVKQDCIEWIRSFFEENGAGCNAVVGISGGKDSSIVAALCVEALGKERVIGVLMPNGVQADIDMAMQEGYSTASDSVRSLGFGAGMGLPNMKRYTDDMKIESTVGEGTTITMTVRLA